MRKFLLMTLVGFALATAEPGTASAAPAIQGEAIKLAADRIDATENVRHRRWHCRYRSGYCGRRYWYVYPRYRYRYYYPRRSYRYRYYSPRRYYRRYRW
jgi:hypothetical protein